MSLLKLALSKRTGKHSDHLMKLERHMEVIDFENMTKEMFLIHLFAEGCTCNVMSKLAMEVLSSGNPSVADLRKKISETENSLWYSDNQKLGKYAGGNGLEGNPGGQNTPQGKYCKPCNSTTHWESQCYGECRFCGKRGHREEWCRNKDQTPPVDPEQAKTGKELKKKKKRRNLKLEKRHWYQSQNQRLKVHIDLK